MADDHPVPVDREIGPYAEPFAETFAGMNGNLQPWFTTKEKLRFDCQFFEQSAHTGLDPGRMIF
jgi:hypothetical protein